MVRNPFSQFHNADVARLPHAKHLGTRFDKLMLGICADLCEAEFEKLSGGDKAFFRAIRSPEDGSESDADSTEP
eukprot:COSAG03_NODE_11406_length_594_cov_1.254545_1_plen_74_part_00